MADGLDEKKGAGQPSNGEPGLTGFVEFGRVMGVEMPKVGGSAGIYDFLFVIYDLGL
jgi:hypothetical protein